MTRGRFILLCQDHIQASYEANGDMYFFNQGYGNDAMKALKGVKNEEEFLSMLKDFNRTHHRYDDIDNFVVQKPLLLTGFDISQDGMYRWTDYIFIKNISDKVIDVQGRDEVRIPLAPGHMTAAHYGRLLTEEIPEEYWDFDCEDNVPAKDEDTTAESKEEVAESKDFDTQSKDLTVESKDESKAFEHKGFRRLFIMRKDLNMSAGKLAAQVAHCAEAYWLHLIREWAGGTNDMLTDSVNIFGDLNWDIYENYVNGAITKTICEAKSKSHLMKARDAAIEIELVEGKDFGLIRDLCLTELEPEDEDGRTTTGIWFRPLPDETTHLISKKYQLYR